MATDYYKMGMGVGGAYFDGKEEGRDRAYLEEKRAREKVLQGRQDEQYTQEQAQQAELRGLRYQMGQVADGVDRKASNAALDDDFEQASQAAATGLALPPMRGGSNAANEAALTVRNRVDPTSSGYQGEMSGLQRQYALAKGDMGAASAIDTKEAGRITMDSRRAESARVSKMTNEELQAEFGKYINPRNDVPAMMGYDAKTRSFVFTSDIPGVPTQTLSRAEIEAGVMGAWEKGTGDYSAGMAALLGLGAAQRGLNNANFDRSAKIAGAQQGLDSDNRKAAQDDRRLDLTAQGMRLRAAGGGGGGSKQIPPEMLKQMNDLSVQIAETKDPQQRAIMEAQYRRMAAQVATIRGQVMQPKGEDFRAGGAGDNRPVPVVEEGKSFMQGGRLVTSDGRGNLIAEGGIAPRDRLAFFEKNKVPPRLHDLIQLSPDGTALGYDGVRYGIDEIGMLVEAADKRMNDLDRARDRSMRRQNPQQGIARPQHQPNWNPNAPQLGGNQLLRAER